MYRETYENWRLAKALTPEERAELDAIASDDQEIKERFHAPLAFGTAGLRGIMGMGLARMNVHVIRHATQGFAEVISAEGEAAAKAGVVIAYDCRINSDLFAKEAASVMAANGVHVRIFPDMRPTPQLSFAIPRYGATAGINITASHNPPAYNGYKVYWSDGAQLPTSFAKVVAARMAEIDLFAGVKTMDYQTAIDEGRITILGPEADEEFLEAVLNESVDQGSVAKVADTFKIVYTPFHGTGRIVVPEALRRIGFQHILPVAAQMVPDGTFATVKSPNPEDPEGFTLALELARANKAELIIGTDPDTDRVGAMVRHNGDYQMISGNQMGVLLLGYLIAAKKVAGTLPQNAAFIQSIVSTEMSMDIAKREGLAAYKTFTGFKNMAEKATALGDSKTVIFSYEESYGYMIGTFVKDKDAVTASLIIAEMAAWYKTRGMTLIDGLEEHFQTLGRYYEEHTLNLVMPGYDGLQKMQALMDTLRTSPPTEIGGQQVVTICDYQSGKSTTNGVENAMELSGSNVLGFTLADGTNFLVRPSGTEPKVKVYILAQGKDRAACQETVRRCEVYAETLRG
ncbi:MAG: phospho-sugar mutase [Oscillospiraceae bacterium]|nr:phospho-sugar mutase [Oscillospiraceae bacterium]